MNNGISATATIHRSAPDWWVSHCIVPVKNSPTAIRFIVRIVSPVVFYFHVYFVCSVD